MRKIPDTVTAPQVQKVITPAITVLGHPRFCRNEFRAIEFL